MNYPELATLMNIIASAVVTRIWGWPGVISYAITFAVLAIVFK